MVIFGNGMATGKYAMGSNEPLDTTSNFAENSLKSEPTDATKLTKDEDVAKMFEAPKGADVSAGSKRKRCMLSDEDAVVLTSVTNAVNNVTEAIRSTKVDEVHLELYGTVMFMHGFTEETLIVAFSHLVNNKAQGIAFVGMSHSHHVLWLRTFLAKNYYM
jgi:hypothetical protein